MSFRSESAAHAALSEAAQHRATERARWAETLAPRKAQLGAPRDLSGPMAELLASFGCDEVSHRVTAAVRGGAL